MSIFDTIATAAAQAPALPTVDPDFDGTRMSPSEGFALPVAPLTKTLYSYQLAAVESALTQGRILLGLQPGMGKTAVAQAVIAAKVAEGGKAIVAVPPSLRVSPWLAEFNTDYPHLNVAIVEGQKQADLPADADVVIIGDSVLAHRRDDIIAWGPTALVADEAHRYKSRTAKRSVALSDIIGSMPVDATVILATGTLATNHAADVYKPLHALGAGQGHPQAKAVSRGESWTRFMDEWCLTEVIWTPHSGQQRVVKGCKDPAGLRQKLVETCMVSIPRDEVLDLPERVFDKVDLIVNGDAAEYRRAEKNFIAWVREQYGLPAAERAAKAEAIAKVMRLWELDGKAKVRAVADYTANLTQQGEQVVIMAHHSEVITALYFALRKHTDTKNLNIKTIAGGMTSNEKAAVVDGFQAGDVDIIIGNIEAAGVGLTLTAASNLIFAQLPWSPAAFGQASDRIYRIGQQHRVVIHVLNMVGGASERLWEVLVAKAEVVDAINTGKPATIDTGSVIDTVLGGFGYDW